MNTHDKYELPPLPDLPAYSSEVFDREVKVVSETMAEQLMHDYARDAIEPYQRRIAELESQLEAIGAGGVTQGQRLIEPDRKRRGEPAPHEGYQPRSMLGPMPPPPPPKGLKPRELVDKFGFLVTPKSSNGDATTERSVDYKKLFEQMCERCDALDAKLAEYSEREPVARVNDDGFIVETGLGLEPGTLLYTAPQPAEPEKEPPCET